jgi:hypothetical protein
MMFKVIVVLAIVALAAAHKDGDKKNMDPDKVKNRAEKGQKEQKCEYFEVMTSMIACMREKEGDMRNVTLGQCGKDADQSETHSSHEAGTSSGESKGKGGKKGFKGGKHGKGKRNHCKFCAKDSFAQEPENNQKAVMCLGRALKCTTDKGDFQEDNYETAIMKIMTKVTEDNKKKVSTKFSECKNTPAAVSGPYEDFYKTMAFMNLDILKACEYCNENGEEIKKEE